MSNRLLTLAVAVALSPVSARLRHPRIRPDQGTNRHTIDRARRHTRLGRKCVTVGVVCDRWYKNVARIGRYCRC